MCIHCATITQEQPVFLEMVRCVFALDDSVTLSPHLDVGGASQQQTTPTPCVTGSDITSPTMDSILTKVIKKARLDPTETWLAKVKEILTLIQVTSRHSELHLNTFLIKLCALDTVEPL